MACGSFANSLYRPFFGEVATTNDASPLVSIGRMLDGSYKYHVVKCLRAILNCGGKWTALLNNTVPSSLMRVQPGLMSMTMLNFAAPTAAFSLRSSCRKYKRNMLLPTPGVPPTMTCGGL